MKQSNQPLCPKCAAVIAEDAPGGLCPKCALENAASTRSSTTGVKTRPPSIEEIAPHFPEMEILELLGAGGMGAVYKARQPQLDRFVALKILSHDLASDPAFVERFNREAKVLARLNHPNIVGVHDFGTASPYCYLMMEYVDGVNLRQAMHAGRFTPTESLALAQHICSALKFAHEEGILHRDIKPENVLIDSKGRVKIADFGIAKLIGEEQRMDVTLTMQGSVLGSPHYMAPEQFESPGDVDQRADIYSLGVVLYELLTGELPLGRFALPSEKAEMDARIDQIVLRTLERERQARFQSADEFSTSVGELSQSPPPASLASASASEESGMARFSLISAILTGTSLILAALFFWLWVMTLTGPFEADNIPEAQQLSWGISAGLGLAILSTVTFGVTGIVGLILGCVALGKIRKSGGVLGGFGLAAFATVSWPFLILSTFSTMLVESPDPRSGAGSINSGLMFLVALVISILSIVIVVRGLSRWAKGVPASDGSKRHPGFGLSTSLAAVLLIVGPFSFFRLTVGLFGDEMGQDPYLQAYEREMFENVAVVSKPNTSHSASDDSVRWHRGVPELIVPIKIHDGYRAEFRLALYDGERNPLKYAEVGNWQPTQRRKNLRIEEIEACQLKIGTTTSEEDDNKRSVTALISSNGGSGTLTADTDFAEWNFDVDDLRLDHSHLPIVAAGSYAHTLAKGEETVDGKTKRTGTLRLEVQVIER